MTIQIPDLSAIQIPTVKSKMCFHLIVVEPEDGLEELVGVRVALVHQGQVQLDQHLFNVQTQQRGVPLSH